LAAGPADQPFGSITYELTGADAAIDALVRELGELAPVEELLDGSGPDDGLEDGTELAGVSAASAGSAAPAASAASAASAAPLSDAGGAR